MKKATIVLLSVSMGIAGAVRALGANESSPTKSLQQAAVDGDVEQIKLHIAKGTNFNATDSYGYTPLKRAIEGHHLEASQVIIDSGKADLNAKDRDGKTPLMAATMNGEQQIAEALVAKGANVNAKDNNDWTALHAAIHMGQKGIATMLIEKGADINATEKSGMVPLAIAQQRGQQEVAELLRQKGAKEPVQPDSLYGDYGYTGDQRPQTPGAPPVPAREAVVVDPNAIREELKPFEGLAAALKTVDDKSGGEQQGWIQRRMDNRTILVGAVERQFVEEMAFVKPIATAEKAEKTVKAIDELSAARKERFEEIAAQLREQRREAMTSSRDSGMMGTGRSTGRGARGRSANMGNTASPGYAPTGPYGAPGTRMPARRGAVEVNEPVLDPATQEQVQAWLNAKPEDKKSLLEAVHQMNLVDLDDLRLVAVEEKAQKTAAALNGLMLAHHERVERITKKWQEDDERMLKLQERYGPGGMMPGRGMQPGMQPQQPGMRPGRRGR